MVLVWTLRLNSVAFFATHAAPGVQERAAWAIAPQVQVTTASQSAVLHVSVSKLPIFVQSAAHSGPLVCVAVSIEGLAADAPAVDASGAGAGAGAGGWNMKAGVAPVTTSHSFAQIPPTT